MPEVFKPQEWVLTHRGTAVCDWVSMITTADGMILIQSSESSDTHDNPDLPPSGIYDKIIARSVWYSLMGLGWKRVK